MTRVNCTHCPLRSFPVFTPFTEAEVVFQQSFKAGELTIKRGTTVLAEGSSSPQLYTVLAGQGVRYKTLENGRRQVLNFVFPGDFLGLQAGLMGEMKHSVEASTAMVLCVFDRAELWQLFRAQPSRAYDLTWIAAAEEHFLGETIATLGQRDAIQRLAWALLRIHERLEAVGLVQDGAGSMPFRQQDLADALGLSLVHTNKTLSRLRERELCDWSDGRLRIMNMDAMARLGTTEREKPERRPLM